MQPSPGVHNSVTYMLKWLGNKGSWNRTGAIRHVDVWMSIESYR